ncbi:hypothetical protein [Bradyrhizobium guangdongense]|uniref:hypothetical protein n=1 Tax=Bradyrhizobium guangdongense TaxID=1325090 RepID=UPI0013E8D231|nr:hypothetical protein [Bradyrhizobium guangdongense]
MSNSDETLKPAPRCEDCQTAMRFRASLFDPRKNGHVRIYDCPTCKRLYWKE